MVMISLGDTEGIIIALLMIALNIYQDKTESKPTDLIGGGVNQSSAILVDKGHYFCPSYCEIDHPHQAHSLSYDCELDFCSHFVVSEITKKLFRKEKNDLDK